MQTVVYRSSYLYISTVIVTDLLENSFLVNHLLFTAQAANILDRSLILFLLQNGLANSKKVHKIFTKYILLRILLDIIKIFILHIRLLRSLLISRRLNEKVTNFQTESFDFEEKCCKQAIDIQNKLYDQGKQVLDLGDDFGDQVKQK